MEKILSQTHGVIRELWQGVIGWLSSPDFYYQLGAIALAILLAFVIAYWLRRAIPLFRTAPATDGRFARLLMTLHTLKTLLFPVLNIFFLETAITIANANHSPGWLLRIAQGLAVVFLFYSIINFVRYPGIRTLLKSIGIPIAVLHVFGWLDRVTGYLDTISLSVGDINLSLFTLLRTLIFGGLLFWFGRVSNTAGKQAIRSQKSLNAGTREVFAKLFEIGLYVVIFLLLLQVMGINLTALAVFGGALGVGLGFGLQQIASNFVSGIIILLDRSITIGDFIELEDGRSGILRELNMRFGVIESFDGKDIMIPNEKFITSSYTNWTHKDTKQRYPINFQVAYSTNLDLLFDNIRAICVEHPTVVSGDDVPIEYRPDAEIAGFGDSGIDILVEFWMEGVDDGKNRVGADLMHSIWRSIQANGMEIPFPQREVRILQDKATQ